MKQSTKKTKDKRKEKNQTYFENPIRSGTGLLENLENLRPMKQYVMEPPETFL
jgi:hypothetical protein